MYENIPDELKGYNQWICWKLERTENGRLTKIPFDANTGTLASVTDASTWATFKQAVLVAERTPKQVDGIGFVFTNNDPFTGIDLDPTDDPALRQDHLKIFQEFKTYAELSPSGKGVHIIARGNIGLGKRDSARKIEIYSNSRYFTFTGRRINNFNIEDVGTNLLTLYHAIKGNSDAYDVGYQEFNKEERLTDREIYDLACNAVNGEKFRFLWNGHWQDLGYPSQSEADQALINIVQFYSKNDEQIARIFRTSSLGQRDKAKRADYVKNMIKKSFDMELPLVNLDVLAQQRKEQLDILAAKALTGAKAGASPIQAAPLEHVEPDTPEASPYTLPPGLLGELALYIYQSAPRPVSEAALAAAITFLAGIVGRSYNVSKTGLNHYIFYLAPTATGKESMASGISKIMSSFILTRPTMKDFQLPGELASGPGLLKNLAKSKVKACGFSIVGEIGYRLQAMASERASPADLSLKRALLDLYNKSGIHDFHGGLAYSSAENNVGSIRAPCFTMLGEGTPITFYSNIDERMVNDGLLPRFTIIEYTGARPKENRNHGRAILPEITIKKIDFLTNLVMEKLMRDEAVEVLLDDETKNEDFNFNDMCDDFINATSREAIRNLWSRARVKVLKLAALVSVGINPVQPVITLPVYNWAKNLIIYETKNFVKKFETGDFISDLTDLEAQQFQSFRRSLADYLIASKKVLTHSYRINEDLINHKIIPLKYIMQRLSCVASFRKDNRRDLRQKVERALETAKTIGLIEEINVANPYYQSQGINYKGRCFVVLDVNSLLGSHDAQDVFH